MHDLTSEQCRAAKAAMREAAKSARAIAAAQAVATQDRFTDAIVACARTSRAAAVSGYWSIGDEVDVRPALEALAQDGVTTALPVMRGRDAPLEFRQWAPGEPLDHRIWGIYEPRADAPVVRPDLVLVPLLAFDAHGGRLGYGGGYYDRTLARLRSDGNATVLACGIAFAGQEVAQVPCEPYDMRLDAVITEDGMRRCAPPARHGAK